MEADAISLPGRTGKGPLHSRAISLSAINLPSGGMSLLREGATTVFFPLGLSLLHLSCLFLPPSLSVSLSLSPSVSLSHRPLYQCSNPVSPSRTSKDTISHSLPVLGRHLETRRSLPLTGLCLVEVMEGLRKAYFICSFSWVLQAAFPGCCHNSLH